MYEPRLTALGYNIVKPLGDALNGLDYIDQHLANLSVNYWKCDA